MSSFSHHKERITISPIDRRGRHIVPEVLSVAHEISGRALRHAGKFLDDPAVTLSLLEEAAATVSRVFTAQSLRESSAIRDLPAYLFRAFIRRVHRLKRKELLFDQRSSNELPESHTSSPSELEMRILIEELLTRFDAKTRDMFYRRMEGYSWKEIGKAYGISAHAAESRFSHALGRLRRKLQPRT